MSVMRDKAARAALARDGWKVGVKADGYHVLRDYCPGCSASPTVDGGE